MGKAAAMLLLLGALYLQRICFAASLINRSIIDESSLLAIKKHINSNILAKNWSQQTSFCSWIGVICSRRHPRVIGLDLSNMDLQGTLATEIGNLSFLSFLDISNNSFSGSIPPQIGKLRRLRVLDMSHNQLNDRIPQSVGWLRRLDGLNLRNNYLTGDIPTSLSACVRVTILDLSYNNLTGSIPTLFGNLSQLEQLLLRRNQLSGELPWTIFNISSLLTVLVGENQISGRIPQDICNQASSTLSELGLFSNLFEGEIPPTLMHCHSLKRLFLSSNKFTGNIPTDHQLRNLSSIQQIALGRNDFTGTIPPAIGNLSNLAAFDVQENNFYGTVPPEMGQLSSLTWLTLNTNQLNGELPQSIFNLSSLQVFSLAFNNLSGALPSDIDKRLPNIETLVLNANQFRGTIPNAISNFSSLYALELSYNSFSGAIPTTLGNLRHLQFLNLMANLLTNNISILEQNFFNSLTTCNYLHTVAISSNPLTGLLPESLGFSNLSSSLERFLASSCQIVSPLPREIGNLSNLILLDLGDNYLTGAIPAELASLITLQNLRLDSNKLEGSISDILCSLRNLYSVNLAYNNFSQQMPSCLGDLSLLREINFSNNAFSSSIPSTLWSNEHVERIYFSNNFLSGSLPQEIGSLRSLIDLDLSGNQLSGEIPSTISQLQNLITLSLSNNKLEGPITESYADMKELQFLDLSHNNLSGSIPKSLETLAYLNYFNVSFNQLSGEIPDGGPFANFTADFFTDNKGLCGAPRFKVEACERSVHTPTRNIKLLKYILPAAIGSVFVVAIILVLIMRNRCVNSSPSGIPPTVLVHERISYYEIMHATSNLNEENLIGRGSSGSVYKGCFSDTMVAAVKVFDLDLQGALTSFDNECQILRSIRHRNLVKVITCCSNLDFKALVMEYLPNGNLEKWLYSADCSLNIFQRLEIMVDVAAALEYLHDGYPSPIVHCDLKPQNILLDEDMVAHVGDFGIAKLLTQEQRMHQTRTLGTIGYMAPEYGSEGLVSTMVDVYSYGILLMEICSRRKPIDEMFCGELTIRTWMLESLPNSVVDVVDKELLNMDDQRRRAKYECCLASTIEVALECTADMPEERPRMRDVVARMKKIKSNLSNRN